MPRGELKNLSESSENRRKLEDGQESPEQKIHAKARKLFVDAFEFFAAHHELPSMTVFEGSWFDAEHRLLEYLDCPDDESGYITELQRKHVSIFFDELQKFVREKRRDPDSREALTEYLQIWRERALSGSDNIFDRMHLEDQIITTAHFSRIPETQGNLAQANMGKLVYGLRHCGDDRMRQLVLQQVLEHASVDTKLDVIHALVTVGSDAMAQGDWAEDAAESIVSFLEKLQEDEKQSPFVHYASAHALATLKQESEQPTRGVVFRTGDRVIGRRADMWREEMGRESLAIGSHILPDKTSYAESSFRRISRDAIASFDHSYTPQSFAWVGREIDQPRKDVPASQDIERVLQTLESPQVQFPRYLERIIAFADERIFSHLGEAPWKTYWDSQKHFSSDPDFVEKLRHELRSLLSRLAYTEVHFDLFEEFEGNERVMPKNENGSIDTALLLQELHRPAMREAIERDMGISLVDLSLREQTQLLRYLATVDYQTTAKGFETIRKHGLNGARAFLSCEHGKHFGDAILQIAEHLEQSAAQSIFKKYCEVVDLTERATNELLRDFYVQEHDQPVDRGVINDELLKRAKDILAACAGRLEKKGTTLSAEDITHELERFEQDAILFASMFKSLAKGKNIPFEQLRGVTLEQRIPAELSEQDRQEMSTMSAHNWIENPNMALFVQEELQEKMDDPKQRFHLLRKDGEIIAFCRFEDLPGKQKEWGSLNVQPNLRGSAIGEAFARTLLEKEGEGYCILGNVHPLTLVGTARVEKEGFVIAGITEVTLPDGRKDWGFRIERDQRDVSRTSVCATMDTEYLMHLERGDESGPEGVIVCRFDLREDLERMKTEMQKRLKHMIVTRYFYDTKNSNIRYLAFEPRERYQKLAA